LPATLAHRDISGQLVFLGTGTSHGIPVIGCGCETCGSTDPRNHRTRCAVALGLPAGNLLIDTPPELRIQLTREKIGLIHAVLYTHAHADHLFGLDDVRIFPRHLGHEVPVYCQQPVEETIRCAFRYAFDPVAQASPAGGVPRLVFHRIDTMPFKVLGTRVVPISLLHGQSPILGYRIGDVAYCTDVKEIPPESMRLLEGLEVLILDCLRYQPHVTHLSVDEAVATARRLAPRRTLFTHMCHHLEHETTNRRLPAGMELAYDGLRIRLAGVDPRNG